MAFTSMLRELSNIWGTGNVVRDWSKTIVTIVCHFTYHTIVCYFIPSFIQQFCTKPSHLIQGSRVMQILGERNSAEGKGQRSKLTNKIHVCSNSNLNRTCGKKK